MAGLQKTEIAAQCTGNQSDNHTANAERITKEQSDNKNRAGEDILPTFGTGRTNDMVTGELKSKIDNLWEIFWTGGLTNPLDVIEQMTYLMFIRDLDDADNVRAKEGGNAWFVHIRVYLPGKVQIGDRKIRWKPAEIGVLFYDFPAAKIV